LEFGEEEVEAIDFLFFFEVNVVRSNAFKCEFFHKVDFLDIWHVLVNETFDGEGKGRAEHHNLRFFGAHFENLDDNWLEVD
jgi:hypothetical protein